MTSRPVAAVTDPVGLLGGVVDALAAGRAQMAALQAAEAALLADAWEVARGRTWAAGDSVDRSSELFYRAVNAEIGAALRVPDRSVQRLMDDAVRLTGAFGETFEALAAGRISWRHVTEILHAAPHITDPALVAVYEACVLPFAEVESANRLREIAPRFAEQVLPRTTLEKHRAARAGRGVRVMDQEDGMAELIATLPAALAHGILDRLTQAARLVRDDQRAAHELSDDVLEGLPQTADTAVATDPPRTLDNVRADVFTDLLLTGTPTGHTAGGKDLEAVRAHVSVVIPVLTLVDPEHPVDVAELDGVGPVDARTAHALAGTASSWTRILTHPLTGAVLGTDQYSPPESLRRMLRVRDGHCRFPGCRIPTRRSDIDHTLDYAHGGHTRADNLAHLCRRHHTMKHATPWTVKQGPAGVLHWTSPTGRIYTDTPLSTVRFAPPDTDPPPF